MKVKGAIHIAEMDESPRAIYSWYYYFGITTLVLLLKSSRNLIGK
jgi:hypothetical protein